MSSGHMHLRRGRAGKTRSLPSDHKVEPWASLPSPNKGLKLYNMYRGPGSSLPTTASSMPGLWGLSPTPILPRQLPKGIRLWTLSQLDWAWLRG